MAHPAVRIINGHWGQSRSKPLLTKPDHNLPNYFDQSMTVYNYPNPRCACEAPASVVYIAKLFKEMYGHTLPVYSQG